MDLLLMFGLTTTIISVDIAQFYAYGHLGYEFSQEKKKEPTKQEEGGVIATTKRSSRQSITNT